MNEKRIDINDIPDSDVGDPVELYELSLEQVLSTPVILDPATQKRIRVQDFMEHGKFSGATQYISSQLDGINYSTIVATAMVHGLSIFQHEHEDVIEELKTLNAETILNSYKTYDYMYQSFKPVVNFGDPIKTVTIDAGTHLLIGHYASLLNIPISSLATACLCSSYAESSLLPEKLTKECANKIRIFNISCNICLDNLKSLRY